MHALAKTKSLRSLNWLNFFLADVATGIGPFLAAFLTGQPGWTATNIGIALSAASIAGLVVQAPIGAWVDSTMHKRALLAVAIVLIALASAAMVVDASFYSVIAIQIVYGIAGASIGPALGAITLGLVGPRALTRVQGRVQAWNHSGNVVAALAAGAIGHVFGLNGVLLFTVCLCGVTLLTMTGVREHDIDHRVARGAKSESAPQDWTCLFTNRPLMALMAAFFLFHFANAAMLPLAGMKLGAGGAASAAPYMSACIVGAQLVMVPVAALAGPLADRFGWKPVLAIGFAVLILRGFLYPLFDNPAWIIGVQLLDGVGAGLFGVLGIVAVAELTQGSGRFNAAQGLAAVFVGIGATASTTAAGYVVDHFGYGTGFVGLAVIGVGALLMLLLGVSPPADAAPARAAHASAT